MDMDPISPKLGMISETKITPLSPSVPSFMQPTKSWGQKRHAQESTNYGLLNNQANKSEKVGAAQRAKSRSFLENGGSGMSPIRRTNTGNGASRNNDAPGKYSP